MLDPCSLNSPDSTPHFTPASQRLHNPKPLLHTAPVAIGRYSPLPDTLQSCRKHTLETEKASVSYVTRVCLVLACYPGTVQSVEWTVEDGNNLLICYGYMGIRRYVVAAELGLITLTAIIWR